MIERVRRLFLSLILLMAPRAFATEVERLGRFEISDFALSPRLRLAEPSQGGFELAQSWIGFSWTRDEWVRGVLKLGSTDLIAPVIWYTPLARPSFGVSEAWMEGRSDFGDVRAGLLAIPTGFESLNDEWSSIFPETRARHANWFIKRDMGLQFLWKTHFWDTSIAVHNGESADNADGKYWVSGHWQFRDSDGTGVLVTSNVGETKPTATTGSKAALPENGFAFDPNSDAKIREFSLALFHAERRNLLLAEGGTGEVIQKGDKNGYAWGHLDWIFNNGGDVSFLLRFEQTQPQTLVADSIVRSYGGGLVFASKDNLQSLTLFGNHVEETPATNNNELWLIFRIHSFFVR